MLPQGNLSPATRTHLNNIALTPNVQKMLPVCSFKGCVLLSQLILGPGSPHPVLWASVFLGLPSSNAERAGWQAGRLALSLPPHCVAAYLARMQHATWWALSRQWPLGILGRTPPAPCFTYTAVWPPGPERCPRGCHHTSTVSASLAIFIPGNKWKGYRCSFKNKCHFPRKIPTVPFRMGILSLWI